MAPPKNVQVLVCGKCKDRTSWIRATRRDKQPQCRFCKGNWPKTPVIYRAEDDSAGDGRAQSAPPSSSGRVSTVAPWNRAQGKSNASEEEVPECIRALHASLLEAGDSKAAANIEVHYPSLKDKSVKSLPTTGLFARLTKLDKDKANLATRIVKLADEKKKAEADLVAVFSDLYEVRAALQTRLHDQGFVPAPFQDASKAFGGGVDTSQWRPEDTRQLLDIHTLWGESARQAEQHRSTFLAVGARLQQRYNGPAPGTAPGARVCPYGGVRTDQAECRHEEQELRAEEVQAEHEAAEAAGALMAESGAAAAVGGNALAATQDYRSEAAAAAWGRPEPAAKVPKVVTFGGPSRYAALDMGNDDDMAAAEAEEKAKEDERLRDILSTAEKAAAEAREAAAAASRP